MFRVDLVSSMVPFFIIFILWCVRVISSVFDECRVIELQFIIGELIEQIKGSIISAKELKVQCSWIVLPLWGQVSVILIWPSNEKL